MSMSSTELLLSGATGEDALLWTAFFNAYLQTKKDKCRENAISEGQHTNTNTQEEKIKTIWRFGEENMKLLEKQKANSLAVSALAAVCTAVSAAVLIYWGGWRSEDITSRKRLEEVEAGFFHCQLSRDQTAVVLVIFASCLLHLIANLVEAVETYGDAERCGNCYYMVTTDNVYVVQVVGTRASPLQEKFQQFGSVLGISFSEAEATQFFRHDDGSHILREPLSDLVVSTCGRERSGRTAEEELLQGLHCGAASSPWGIKTGCFNYSRSTRPEVNFLLLLRRNRKSRDDTTSAPGGPRSSQLQLGQHFGQQVVFCDRNAEARLIELLSSSGDHASCGGEKLHLPDAFHGGRRTAHQSGASTTAEKQKRSKLSVASTEDLCEESSNADDGDKSGSERDS
ncbi:unnamed protein product [Amoebophrya sp. A120]|nr:unnamed protein product [Amoebophrya sp. A120]|eukprot:GSA120T00021540001.1